MTTDDIQRQAAASTDELLCISEDIGKYVVSAYGKVPAGTFELQCRLQLERCRRLSGKLKKLLAEAEEKGVQPDAADPLQAQRAQSMAVTRQLILQNQLMLEQKETLLNDFLAHSDMIQKQLDLADSMADEAEIRSLRKALQELL